MFENSCLYLLATLELKCISYLFLFFLLQAFNLWVSSLCHSLVLNTFIRLFCFIPVGKVGKRSVATVCVWVKSPPEAPYSTTSIPPQIYYSKKLFFKPLQSLSFRNCRRGNLTPRCSVNTYFASTPPQELNLRFSRNRNFHFTNTLFMLRTSDYRL